jgi:hypothetical protein
MLPRDDEPGIGPGDGGPALVAHLLAVEDRVLSELGVSVSSKTFPRMPA